jgi:hypothetical protein
MKKGVIVTHFTMKITLRTRKSHYVPVNHTTYLYINCNKKILMVKKILAYCGY